MKLNEKSKNELRKMIEEKLTEVPEGQRVHIDKKLLDELMFFEIPNDEGYEKIPIWTGQFLRKIDLSELSFEKVIFSKLDGITSIMDIRYYLENYFDYEEIEKLGFPDEPPFVHEGDIDFSGTNIVVDFTGKGDIDSCNFEGVDLSNSNFDSLCYISRCNFSNTGIKINFKDLYVSKFVETNFSNNDLSYANIDFKDLYRCISNCNFSNTGLNIVYTPKVIPEEILDDYHTLLKWEATHDVDAHSYGFFHYDRADYWISEVEDEIDDLKENWEEYSKEFEIREELSKMISQGFLEGCYINQKKVLNKEERKELAIEKNHEYEKYKQEIIASVVSSIEEQTKGMKR